MPISSGRPDASRSRPYQNCTVAEQFHSPLMFTHMPSVYSSEPSPNPTSGHRFGPSRLSKSTRIALSVNSTLVIADVSAQLLKSAGLSQMFAFCRLNNCTVKGLAPENELVTPLAVSLACARQK